MLCKHRGGKELSRRNSNAYCYTNTDKNSDLNNSNTFTPMVKNNDVKYFLPGPSQERDRTVSAEIKKQLQWDLENILIV